MRSEKGEMRAKEIRAAYQRENMRTLAVNVKKEKAEAFKAIAEKNGMAAARLLKDYVDMVCETGDVSVSTGSRPAGVAPTMVRLTERNFNRLFHETSFHNPKNLNPDELLNDILRRYFKLADELRGE